MPGPVRLRAEGRAGRDGLGQARAGVLGGPLDGRLREPDAGHLLEQFGPLLEAVGDRPGQGGDPLQGRGQVAGGQAGVAVEGEQALAAGAAEVVGAAVADRPHEAEARCARGASGTRPPGRSAGRSRRRRRIRFFSRQVLLDGLGGDLVGDGADLELVVAEEVGVVGGGEVGGQFVDLGVDGLADGLREVLDLGLLLGRAGVRTAWVGSGSVVGFSAAIADSLLCTKIPPTFKTPTPSSTSTSGSPCRS